MLLFTLSRSRWSVFDKFRGYSVSYRNVCECGWQLYGIRNFQFRTLRDLKWRFWIAQWRYRRFIWTSWLSYWSLHNFRSQCWRWRVSNDFSFGCNFLTDGCQKERCYSFATEIMRLSFHFKQNLFIKKRNVLKILPESILLRLKVVLIGSIVDKILCQAFLDKERCF